LYALTSGESLLNDAVAIALFDTLQGHLGDEAALDDSSTYQSMAVHFMTVSIGSMVTAMLLGVCSVLFFVTIRGRQSAVFEVATFFGWALVPYYVAESLEFSGIIAILTMGFIMDYYIMGGGMAAVATSRSVARETRITLTEILGGRGLLSANCCQIIQFISHAIASTMETIIFAYLGLFLFDDKVYSMELDQVAIWSCVISRAIMVSLLSFMVNLFASRCRRSSSSDQDHGSGTLQLDPRTQVMLFLAGIRGAVSFALVSKLPVYDVITQKGTIFKAELKAMTSTAIIFTVSVFGALAYFFSGSFRSTGTSKGTCSSDTQIGRGHAIIVVRWRYGSGRGCLRRNKVRHGDLMRKATFRCLAIHRIRAGRLTSADESLSPTLSSPQSLRSKCCELVRIMQHHQVAPSSLIGALALPQRDAISADSTID
jgi:NhaP-type Na+/H+ or K+/H+ antiporter